MEEGTQFTAEEEACLDIMEKTLCRIEKKHLAAAAQDHAIQDRIEARLANLLVLIQERFGKPTTSSQRTSMWVQDSTKAAKMTKSSEINRRSQILDSHTQEWQFTTTKSVPEAKSTKGSTTIQELKSLPILEATTMEGSGITNQDLYQINEESNSSEKEETLFQLKLGKNATLLLEEGRTKPAHKEGVIVVGLAAERRMTPSPMSKPTDVNLTVTANKVESTEEDNRSKNEQMPDKHDVTQAAVWVPLMKDHHAAEATAMFSSTTEATVTLSNTAKALVVTASRLVKGGKVRSQSWVATNGVLGLCATTGWAVVQKQAGTAGDGSGMVAGGVSLWWLDWEAYWLAFKSERVPCPRSGWRYPWPVAIGFCTATGIVSKEKKLGSSVE